MAESEAHNKMNAVRKEARQILFDEDVEGTAVNLMAWVLQAKQMIQELQHIIQEQQITMHNLLAQMATGQPPQSQSPAQSHNRSGDLLLWQQELRQQELRQQLQQLEQQVQTLHFPSIVTENVTTPERPATASAWPVADISTSGMVCANTMQQVQAALVPVKKEKISITNASIISGIPKSTLAVAARKLGIVDKCGEQAVLKTGSKCKRP